MRLQKSIVQYFDKIISSIKQMEQNSTVFSELKGISEELELLEQYVKTTLDTLDNNFNSFVRQINLLSELVEFQRSVLNFKSSDKMMSILFEFLQRNVRSDHGFIVFKLKEEDQDDILLADRNDQTALYRRFIDTPEMALLKSIVQERDMAYLITDVQQFSTEQSHWEMLQAKSIILFPVKVRGNFLGMGLLVRQSETFELNDLSFVNLVIGLVSLLIYQHFYFAKLKTRLFKQFRLRKMLEEVKYAEYFEKGPLYIFTLDPRYVILHTNTAAISNLKIDEEMIIGDNFLELIPKSYRAGMTKVLDEAEEGRVQYFRSPLISRPGVEPMLEFYVSQLILQNNFNLILVFGVDITQMYYRDLAVRRNGVLDELDQFSRTLIGEFNNLLTVILPNVSLLRTRMDKDHAYQHQLEAIENAAHRSANLIQKFLNYDLVDFEAAEVGNLNKVVKAFIHSLRSEIPAKVEIKFQLDPGAKNITYYPLRIRQLLKNLLDNSLLALQKREEPEICFSTRYIVQAKDGLVENRPFFLKAGKYMELSVQDNGCGIPEKSLSQVLKPFYSTRIKNEGVGLGLFIAYNIVKDMKGQIYIESEYEKFTTVYIYLPIKEEQSMEVLTMEKDTTSRDIKKGKATVLVVDDEYNIRSMMREIMEMYGLKVYTAGNGRDGVDVYQRFKSEIDLVILDMVMPVMDGRAAFDEIKKIDSEQKIFIISGYSQREDLEDMLQKGAIGFLRKPFQVKEIVNKIREILELPDLTGQS